MLTFFPPIQQPTWCFLLIKCICSASFAVFRAAVWIRPIKAWRCSWWPLANRMCQRFCSDPSPPTRKPHTDTLCPHVRCLDPTFVIVLLTVPKFWPVHKTQNRGSKYVTKLHWHSGNEEKRIHTDLDHSFFLLQHVVVNCFTCFWLVNKVVIFVFLF